MTTVNQKEIQNFSKDSKYWWDENGPFKPLHRLNPVRLSYFKDQICKHFNLNKDTTKPYDGIKIIDIGCGGGLVCEPMARLGGIITGIDADENAIEVATNHAEAMGLNITYEQKALEDIDDQYDVVLALEIIEHVDHPEGFVKNIFKICKPGGLVIFSTLNRTPKSFLLGKVAAEYILNWVPKGTHDWKKFIKPSELTKMIRQNQAQPHDICGLIFDPLKNEFKLDQNKLDVNYFISVKI